MDSAKNTTQKIMKIGISTEENIERKVELELEIEINKELYEKKIIDRNTYEKVFKELIKEQKAISVL
ncbi:MAG: hypothetical protein FWC79_05245 [Oscillospiraceae bacterium]|nr:hypothetical protein [Oscillospiraceae bacterium]